VQSELYLIYCISYYHRGDTYGGLVSFYCKGKDNYSETHLRRHLLRCFPTLDIRSILYQNFAI
jgi:hypothetical protein